MLQRLLDGPLALVDIETTGGDPRTDRVIEVAVIEVRPGAAPTQWSTLVNPEVDVPPAIESLTGITAAMLDGAPRFPAIARELHERLAGRTFVAHNVRFDYGFLQREFARAGVAFEEKQLCTVRLSRRLYPMHARHNLTSLIERHNLACAEHERHRALGDARVLEQFLRVAIAEHGFDAVAEAADIAARQPRLPPQLDPLAIDAIPEAPGVYTFFSEAGAALYVGAANALRSRILAHFTAGGGTPSPAKLSREVFGVEHERTAGPVGAELRAAALREALAPKLNRRPRTVNEPPPPWPWRGAIALVERYGHDEESQVHVIDRWTVLGTARCDDEVAEILASRARASAAPLHHRLLEKHLIGGRPTIVNLG